MFGRSLSFCDIMHFPASSFTFISQNSSATTSLLDRIICTNPQLVSQIRNFYGDTLHDHFPMYCEFAITCINSQTIVRDQHAVKYYIKKDNITDDQNVACCFFMQSGLL